MADSNETYYISKVNLPGDNKTYHIKDQWARDKIETIGEYKHYLGVTTTALVDNVTTNPVVSIGGTDVTADVGSIVSIRQSGKPDKEFVYAPKVNHQATDPGIWQEFGSSGSPSTTVTAVSSSASAGTATTYSRGDHTHNISVATGDNNGQVKIAGQNASVKGLGDAAYRGVTDNSSSTSVTSTDTNLITGRTLYYSGYTKNTGTVTSVTIKANSPISVDSTSAITGSGTRTLSHANSGVSAGTYKSVTVNATGHVTSGSNPTTLSGYGISDAYTKTYIDGKVGVSDNAIDAIAMDGTKNKLQNTASSTGIFTVNSDGTVTATVPASNTQTSLTLFTSDSDISFDHDMVLSGCPSGGGYTYRWSIYLLDANGNLVWSGNNGMADEGITRVVPAGTAFRSIRILIRANIGAQTLTFKPMLCDKDLYELSSEYIPYAPTNRELYEADKELGQIKFTPETSVPTSSQRLLFTSSKSTNNLTMLVGKLDSSTNYVQFYINGVDKGYIKFDVSRNINTWQ